MFQSHRKESSVGYNINKAILEAAGCTFEDLNIRDVMNPEEVDRRFGLAKECLQTG